MEEKTTHNLSRREENQQKEATPAWKIESKL